MHDHIVPKLPKWPFFLGDALMLGLAYFICFQSGLPLHRVEIAAIVLCVVLGAGLGVLPFLSEYRAIVKLAQAENLASAVSQIQNVEQIAAQISSATNHWQTAQDAADKTTKAAKEIADGMAAELKGFSEFMQRANESEKATLRLEVEKLRRAETEWLQILMRMLDHVFALHTAAVRSGQAGVIKQIDSFQNACRDVARRAGLIPFIAAPAEPFDEQRHQLIEGDSKAAAGVPVEETVATGYTFQGRLLRPALVRLQNQTTDAISTQAARDQLPLESVK
jgi:molecular chaperone GrpE (heat shock protein)